MSMALRVLLADESNTIKKVFQLSLQEYAVDVRPVNIGIDVVQVAQSFKPHIIFADVLLQKLNGYDVCSELKANEDTKNIPIVLMWSSFMEFDMDKFQACGANERLEKPFEVTDLKALINKYVPNTSAQKLSQFLTLPDLPDMKSEQGPAATPHETPHVKDPASATNWGLESFDPIPNFNQNTDDSNVSLPELSLDEDEFKHMDIPATPQLAPEGEIELDLSSTSVGSDPKEHFDLLNTGDEDDDESWQQQTINPTTIKSAPKDDDLQVEQVNPKDVFEARREVDSWSGYERRKAPVMDEKKLREFIDANYKDEIQALVKEMLPKIAREIIQKELNDLLSEMEGSP